MIFYLFMSFSRFSSFSICETCESSLQRPASLRRIYPSWQCNHASTTSSRVWQCCVFLQKQRDHVCSSPDPYESILHLFYKRSHAILGHENQPVSQIRVREYYICHQGVSYNFRASYLLFIKKNEKKILFSCSLILANYC